MARTRALTGLETLEGIIETIRERIRRGEEPKLEEYVERLPALAGELRALWPALVMMEDLGGSSLGDAGSSAAPDSPSIGTTPPGVLDDFRLLRQIGRGGMGVVYEAEQVSLGRRVALKVLPPDVTGDRRRLSRFGREARAAGRLHHTNIVPVFGLSEHEGTHFYVMPLIQGLGLDSVIEELKRIRKRAGSPARGAETTEAMKPAATRMARSLIRGDALRGVGSSTEGSASGQRGDLRFETGPPGGAATEPVRSDESGSEPVIDPSDLSTLSDLGTCYWDSVARIGLQAADALEYAHDQGILHRDIKPANLLLDLKGTLWVTDFGLAKAVDDDASRSHDLAGTIRYMGPERFQGQADGRSDVYALGLTLYEMLALRPAFEAKDHHQLVRLVTQGGPPALAKRDPTIPRDLVTIVQKAIEREPSRRYATAGAMAEDLRRFLERRPIAARRTRSLERAWMWCRRNPALAASYLAAAALTATVAVVSTIAAVRLNDSAGKLQAALSSQTAATRAAEAAEIEALRSQYNALVSEARASRFSGRQGQRFGTLKAVGEANALLPRLGFADEEMSRQRDELRDLAVAALALADLRQTTWPDYPGIRDDWDHFAVSPDGALRVRGDRDNGTLVVTRATDDSEVARLPGAGVQRAWMRFSPCNRYLTFGKENEWLIWTMGDPHDKVVPCPVRAAEVVFSNDGQFLYILCPEAGQLLRVNCHDGGVGRVYTIPKLPALHYCNMSIAPGGDRLALAYGAYRSPESKILRILDLETGQFTNALDCGVPLLSISWGASGALLAAGPINGSEVALWDMTKNPPARLETLNQRRESNIALAFNTSGALLACVSNWGGGGLTVYEPNTRRQLLRVAGFTLDGQPTRMLGRNGGDRIIATVQGGRTLVQSDIVPGSAFRSLTRTIPGYEVYSNVTIHKDNRLAAGGTSGGAVLWDLATGQQAGELPTGGNVWFEPEGDALWTSDSPWGQFRWPLRRAGRTFRIGPPTRLHRVGSFDLPVRASADGRLAALSPGHHNGAIVFPLDHPEQAIRVADGQDIRNLDVTPDGRFVITRPHPSDTTQTSLWDAKTGKLLLDLQRDVNESPFWREWSRAHDLPPGTKPWQSILELRLGWFSDRLPDRRLVFEKDGPGRIRIEQIDTERVVVRLNSPLEENYRAIAVSPDGGHVLATGNDDPGGMRMWDLRLARKELAAMGLDWDAPPIPDWPAGEDTTTPLKVEVITGPIHDPGYETKWQLGFAERRLASEPGDSEAHYERGIALSNLARFDEAEASLDRSLELRPNEPRALLARARVRAMLGRPGEPDEQSALKALAGQGDLRSRLAFVLNNRAWQLASPRDANATDARWGLLQARQAVRLESSGESASQATLNTLGICLYRARLYGEAVEVLSRSLASNQGYDAFDLFFRAMARHRLGDSSAARVDFDRALQWIDAQASLA